LNEGLDFPSANSSPVFGLLLPAKELAHPVGIEGAALFPHAQFFEHLEISRWATWGWD